MSARFTKLLFALPLGLLCSLVTSPPAHAGPPEPIDVSTCANYEEIDISERAFDVRISSTCAKAIRCKVEWELSCNPDRPTTKRSHSFTVRPNKQGSARVSAQLCKPDDDWAVEELSWYCNEV